jgi:LysR family transcriptional regulator, transcriptional activator of the cysJI operon
VTVGNLRLVRDVCNQKSISRAARLNGLSQSAASQQIQEMEKELGVTLFDRHTRPLTITTGGRLFLEYCRDVLRRREELDAALDKLNNAVSGSVRLAAIYSVGLSEMAAIEQRFAARFPEAELQVRYLRPERVYQAVVEDDADLGLMSYAESSREVLVLPWRDEEMVVAVAPGHALASFPAVSPKALEGAEFVGFDEDLPIQAHIDRYLREHRVSVETNLRFDNLQSIKNAVVHGAGISIMPRRVMEEEIAQNRLAALRLTPAELYRPVRIVHRRKKVFNQAARSLLALLQEETSNVAA